MRALLKHLWTFNRDTALKKSIANCHTRGVHSIVLSDAPGAMVRLFYAGGTYHELWKNTPEMMYRGLSVGFHPHHCDLTLVPIIGRITNWIVDNAGDDRNDIPVTKFKFDSKIRGGTGGFVKLVSEYVKTDCIETIEPGNSLTMKAQELHTVFVPRGAEAMWLVLEGPEDPNYSPVCFSNVDLENAPIDNLYKPMDPAFAQSIMMRALNA